LCVLGGFQTVFRREDNSVTFAPNDARSLHQDDWHQWKIKHHQKQMDEHKEQQ